MSHAQQSSIRSFFQPRRQPEYAAPPSASTAPPEKNATIQSVSPPPAPPVPPITAASRNATAAQPTAIPITLPPNGIPVLPSPPSLPSGATIVPLAEQHIPALRRINSLLLPVPYPDSFYAKALDPLASGLFSRAILWQDSDADAPKVIGGLVCRLEPNPFLDSSGEPIPNPSPPTNSKKPSGIPLDTPYHAIYIQSLVLLSPYRSLGLAAAALDHIIASAALLPAAGSSVDARTIYAHVWTDNEDGLKWYEARGFAREGREPVKGYYFKLRPDTAWVVRRHIGAAAGGVGVGPAFFAHGGAAVHASSVTTTTTTTTTELQDSNKPPKAGAATVLAAAVNLPPMTTPPVAAAAPPPPTNAPPSSQAGPARRPSPSPNPITSSLSFQKARPETEWNDLPADMVISTSSNTPPQLLSPPPSGAAGTPASGRSSRSSSTAPARKKRERAYPTAAFGGQ